MNPFLTWFIFWKKTSQRNWTLLINITQRIEPTFFEFDSKNWTFFFLPKLRLKACSLSKKNDSKNSTFFFFLNTTLGIDVFWVWLKDFSKKYDTKNCCFQMWLEKWTFFWNVARRISTLFYYDSKNWTRFFFFRNYTLRIELLL